MSVFAAVAASAAALMWPALADSPPVGPPTVPPSASPPQALGDLTVQSPLLGFSGQVDNPTPLPLVDSPFQPVCAAECREFAFVDAGPGPVLVSIKSTVTGPGGTFNANDGFDLFVYGPSGTLVASGYGIGANGQAVELASPSRGTYTIVVDFTYAEDSNAGYQGEVRLLTAKTWSPPSPTCGITVGGRTGCFDLPVMQAVPAYDLAVDGLPPVASTPLGFPFPVSTPTQNSCYVDESYGLDNPSPGGIEQPVQRCLRFTSDVRNVGAGPLEVQIPWVAAGSSGPQSGFAPGQCQADQVVVTPTGSAATRPAGACEFHVEHAHFHYKDLISFDLYKQTATGGVGAPVGSSLKESFCLTDDDYFGYGTAGPNNPRQFVGQPDCNLPATPSASGAHVLEGISGGWGDVYTWDTPDQFIDITGLPSGTYDLVEKTNPSGNLLVAGPAQTCALTVLTLTNTSVATVSTSPSIACP